MYACNHAQLNKLLKQGTLISLVCDKGLPLHAYEKTAPFILAVGSEAHGLSEELLSITDQCLTIPLEPTCESQMPQLRPALRCMHQTCRDKRWWAMTDSTADPLGVTRCSAAEPIA